MAGITASATAMLTGSITKKVRVKTVNANRDFPLCPYSVCSVMSTAEERSRIQSVSVNSTEGASYSSDTGRCVFYAHAHTSPTTTSNANKQTGK